MRTVFAAFCGFFLLASSLHAKDADPGFPLRARFPDVQLIDIQELYQKLDAYTVVDVRSSYEYQTLRIMGALNIPLATGFGAKIAKLAEQSNKPIVFYCNGRTCQKSYEAALLAVKARVNNVYTFDAGIADWAKQHPDKTTLLGKTPMQAGEFIDDSLFKAHLLDPKDFVARAKADDRTIVLDVRDRKQRDNPLFPLREKRAQLDEKEKLREVIEIAKREQRTLLVYDEVGKQVQWFQYELQGSGLKDYYFMKGGAQGYYDATLGKVTLGKPPAAK